MISDNEPAHWLSPSLYRPLS